MSPEARCPPAGRSLYEELRAGIVALVGADTMLEPSVAESLSSLMREPSSMRELILLIENLEVSWPILAGRLLEVERKASIAKVGISERVIALAKRVRPVYDSSQVLL